MLVEIKIDGETVYKRIDVDRSIRFPVTQTMKAILDIMVKEPEKYGDKKNDWMGGYDWIRFIAVDRKMCVIPFEVGTDY